MSDVPEYDFPELVRYAEQNSVLFRNCPQRARIRSIAAFYRNAWDVARARHLAGSSGRSVLNELTYAADTLVQGIVQFGLAKVSAPPRLRRRIALVALGGYGRGELSPHSDLDLCLLYTGRQDQTLRDLNDYLVPTFWDVGFKMGYIFQHVKEARSLAASEPEVFTSYMQARLVWGDTAVFGALERGIEGIQRKQEASLLAFLRNRESLESLPEEHQDLHNTEPDIKENVGGLRDAHVARWIVGLRRGNVTLDDLERLGELRSEDNLYFQESLDFIWRVRNELHFHTGKPEDRLSFAHQKHVASALGYGDDGQPAIDRFMKDYYSAARVVRRMLRLVVGIAEIADNAHASRGLASRGRVTVVNGELTIGAESSQWFAEYPPRLMEIMWESCRRQVPLDHVSRERVTENLGLVGEAFRRDDLVRRFFVALCSRPLHAGEALRQAAETGLLGAYIPEYADVDGVVRYEDFHSYPVDEHTLRAIEAIGTISDAEGPIGHLLQRTLEHLRDPHILIIAILCHDLGKVSGEEHVEEGVRIVEQIGGRMGMAEEDVERIAFLVRHHMAMNHIAMYRDTDDLDIVAEFAHTMGALDRLQALLLLSYADLSAVGPNVWTEWKGALLAKLYLKAEQILLGRAPFDEAFWTSPKAKAVETMAPEDLRPQVEGHLKQLGERYFVAFTPPQIVAHMACLDEARSNGLSVRVEERSDTGTSDVVVCTRSRHGLFAQIAGCLTAQLSDVRRAAVFTTPDGFAVDSFTVVDAANRRALTAGQVKSLTRNLERVLLDEDPVQDLVDKSRNRLFGFNKVRVPIPTRISFDNEASRTDTVLDIETGDRTGLLYDIARVLAGFGIDFQSSHVVTDARQVRDAFYIRLGDAKVADEALQASIQTALEGVFHSRGNADG